MATDVKPENVHLLSPKEILEYGKKQVGKETKLVPGRYPVEYEPIRRFCHMCEDTNPLYLDPEYARKAGFENAVCPPLLIGNFAGPGIWPPTREEADTIQALPQPPPDSPRISINAGTEWEFFKTVVVGDRLFSKNRIGDVYTKGTKADPEAIWVVTESIVSNQRGEVVAVSRTMLCNWRKPVKKAA